MGPSLPLPASLCQHRPNILTPNSALALRCCATRQLPSPSGPCQRVMGQGTRGVGAPGGRSRGRSQREGIGLSVWQRLGPEPRVTPHDHLAFSKSSLQKPEMTPEGAPGPGGTAGSCLRKDSPWEGEGRTAMGREGQDCTPCHPAPARCAQNTYTLTLWLTQRQAWDQGPPSQSLLSMLPSMPRPGAPGALSLHFFGSWGSSKVF